jgi:nicotinamidase-related amidase
MSINYRTINNKIAKHIEHQKAHNIPVNNTRDKHVHTFAKRTVNLTNAAFTKEESQLLDKGLKYNLHHKPKNWILTLAMEAK